MIKVIHFNRKPTSIHFSIENLFLSIKEKLESRFFIYRWVSPWYSSGLVNRSLLCFSAFLKKGEVNHILGDIHFLALVLPSRNTILTIHDLGFLENQRNSIVKWILKFFWITLPVKRVSIITVVSEATKKYLVQVSNVNPRKVRVIGNFVSESFKPFLKPFDSFKPIILFIGSADNKNLDRLIDALEGLDCTLVIIGYPIPAQKLKLVTARVDHEIYSGLTQEQLIMQYQRCDMLAFVSVLEGFGLPILEAQAVGRPVVTSNLSSMPEVAGEGACLVNPYDVLSIKNGILKVIQDEDYRNDLIQKGFENCRRFSLEKVANQYADLYEEVYNQSKSKLTN